MTVITWVPAIKYSAGSKMICIILERYGLGREHICLVLRSRLGCVGECGQYRRVERKRDYKTSRPLLVTTR
ncbi:hypothetical protein TELCIR_04567 [Teladorsagia circumcincta]|uniref:Uncharacterized protein n=1 Tax=Teladorsagia circumcincta TaxID=45464 RepID=A0A2G9UVE3_TELCI|nr:hypothetical protein TELCIR_04567 [Teladorsagia circumcincta]